MTCKSGEQPLSCLRSDVWLVSCGHEITAGYVLKFHCNRNKLFLLCVFGKVLLQVVVFSPFFSPSNPFSPHYLQKAAVSFLATGAVSGRGHWSRKARPFPSSALLSSGCSPPPPDRCCCQTPLWGGGERVGEKVEEAGGKEGGMRGGCSEKQGWKGRKIKWRYEIWFGSFKLKTLETSEISAFSCWFNHKIISKPILHISSLKWSFWI